jgi:hypothetical protein
VRSIGRNLSSASVYKSVGMNKSMANKTLKFSISAGDARRASVNGVRLPLTNGKGEKSLPPGGHRIQWLSKVSLASRMTLK